MLLYFRGQSRRQRGLSLIEATMVLALSAVVVSGALLYFQSVRENRRLQRAVAEVGQLREAVQDLWAGKGDYRGLQTDKLSAAKSIDPVFRGGSNDLVNPWGGAVTVATRGNVLRYEVTFSGVPRAACIALAPMNFGRSMESTGINGGTAWGNMSPGAAATQCNRGDNNQLRWSFK